MIRTSFFDIIETIAKAIIADPTFWDQICVVGINPSEWPESNARKVAVAYAKMRDRNGHEFAAHMLAADANSLRFNDLLPLEVEVLAPIYHEQQKVFLAQRLAQKLIAARADQIDGLIGEFLMGQASGIQVTNFGDAIPDIVRKNQDAIDRKESIVRLPDWEILSDMIGGFNGGRVGLLVADTGFGKTNLSLSLARCACRIGPSLFVNMEMNEQDIGDKLLMGATGTAFRDYKRGQYKHDAIAQVHKEMLSRRLLFTHGKALSLNEIAALARKEKSTQGLFMVFVDYDQKIKLNTSREIPEWKALQLAIESLEELAKELNVFILVMSQSNEEGDPSGSRRSKNPSSVVLRFYKANEKPVIQTMKNRFGPVGTAVEVEYQADQASVREKSVVVMAKPGEMF
ncbi:MAG: DnaB helicase C-terminal domain-containing protein [Bdellovibrionaceae bacterium]|nr:DnaB helicase C-terminal domain-containing protein [Pseudobdellovibrionaceae bacterium]